ncbi:unnamed protein product [Owenia fusiformis]|uniref:Uncharacterized protein n=1 Tax=Owenia fusiformis TaxID=6347 RepID=A0A8J1Y7E2_OWEFU|nr:unnamed protein product [Owenia fusiformis]
MKIIRRDISIPILATFLISIDCFVAQSMTSSFRPGSRLARKLLEKYEADQVHRNTDHASWYHVNLKKIPEELCSSFIQSHQDEETSNFLEHCFDKSEWIFTQFYHSLMKSILGWFMTQTSINGFLERGSMFVFSTSQFDNLLGLDPLWKSYKLLDLGAGDGKVTERIAHHFNETFATEASKPMTWRLKEKGYKILEIDEWADGKHTYDVITCLNLLDRIAQPITLLQEMHRVLAPDTGRLVVAVVLPFKPYVEFGSEDNRQIETVSISGRTFEEQITSLINDIFLPAGFQLLKFTRLPYLCEGDMEQSFYVLHDAVFVLKRS